MIRNAVSAFQTRECRFFKGPVASPRPCSMRAAAASSPVFIPADRRRHGQSNLSRPKCLRTAFPRRQQALFSAIVFWPNASNRLPNAHWCGSSPAHLQGSAMYWSPIRWRSSSHTMGNSSLHGISAFHTRNTTYFC